MKDKQVTGTWLTGGMIVSMFLWGLSWPSGKVLTGYCSVVNFTVYRYIIVVASMVIILMSVGMNMSIKKAGIPLIIVSGVLLAIYSYFFFLGLKTGSPGAGGVLVTTLNPIMAYSIGILINRRMPTRNESIGLLLGLVAGFILLKMWGNLNALLDSGNLYFLLASFIWAVMSKFTAQGAKYGSSPGFSLWQYVVTLLCLLPMVNIPELQAAVHIRESVFWLNLVFSSAIVTAFATTIYFYTTTRLGAERASSFIFLVPLAAAISSWLLLGEKILPHTAIGGILGIAAVYIMNKKKPQIIEETVKSDA